MVEDRAYFEAPALRNAGASVGFAGGVFLMKWLVKWLRGEGEYQRGVFALMWADVKRFKLFYVKFLFLMAVLGFTTAAVLEDFEVVEGYDNYGIKAATCAVGAAVVVLVRLIPTTGLTKPFFNPFVSVLGGLMAFVAGVFWLLSETSGSVGPYLTVFLVSGLVLFVVAGVRNYLKTGFAEKEGANPVRLG